VLSQETDTQGEIRGGNATRFAQKIQKQQRGEGKNPTEGGDFTQAGGDLGLRLGSGEGRAGTEKAQRGI